MQMPAHAVLALNALDDKLVLLVADLARPGERERRDAVHGELEVLRAADAARLLLRAVDEARGRALDDGDRAGVLPDADVDVVALARALEAQHAGLGELDVVQRLGFAEPRSAEVDERGFVVVVQLAAELRGRL